MIFETDYKSIQQRIENIDPLKYGKTRNYLNGDVTYLSPFISRGIISTRQIAKAVLAKGYHPSEIESFLKELAWRDYFQQVWIALGDEINEDVKNKQVCNHFLIPKQLVEANTNIEAIDKCINDLYQTGYMHNHSRMYVASLACNIAKSHWRLPARWMYYHLLDADWASNALSWQWVAGAFSSKKYYTNQENINKYCNTNQSGTILDKSYEDLAALDLSSSFEDTIELNLQTQLPNQTELKINYQLPTYIYNFYNLDCNWDSDVQANRILLLEPTFFKQYPVCYRTIDFVINLSKNIEGVQLFTGSFDDLLQQVNPSSLNFKEHPTNKHYKGVDHSREWMFENTVGYYPSFFSFWNKASKKTTLWSK
jgi:deoxyribodipyrimidine photo-lyase